MILLFEAILLALLFLVVSNNQSVQNRENAKIKKHINKMMARQEAIIEEIGIEEELSYWTHAEAERRLGDELEK